MSATIPAKKCAAPSGTSQYFLCIRHQVSQGKYCDSALILRIQTGLNLFTSDGDKIYSTSIDRKSKARELEDWAKQDAQPWNEALHQFIDEVTKALLDDVFVHIAPPAQFVRVPTESYAEANHDVLIEKQPTLAWGWSQLDDSPSSGESTLLGAEVTYDFRIIDRNYDRVAYEKYGLSQTEHKLEKKLKRNRLYRWQVRANFSQDGIDRRTKWLGDFSAIIRRR